MFAWSGEKRCFKTDCNCLIVISVNRSQVNLISIISIWHKAIGFYSEWIRLFHRFDHYKQHVDGSSHIAKIFRFYVHLLIGNNKKSQKFKTGFVQWFRSRKPTWYLFLLIPKSSFLFSYYMLYVLIVMCHRYMKYGITVKAKIKIRHWQYYLNM